MKRFCLNILLLAFLLMSSCAKEDREDNSTNEQGLIGFWSYVGSSTRAEDRVDNNFLSFSVTAYTVDSEGELNSLYMPKTTVSRTSIAADAWSIEGGSYYWPLTTPLSFFAFYPTSTTPFIEMADSDDDVYTPYIDYYNDFFAKNQPDMIVACELNQVKDAAATISSAVNLTFSHIMTKVNFTIVGENEDLTYNVTEIKINAHHRGEFFFDIGNSRSDIDIDSDTSQSSVGWWELYTADSPTEPQTYDEVYNTVYYADELDDTEESVDPDNREFIYFDNETTPLSVGAEVLDDDGNSIYEMTLEDGNSFMMLPQTLPSNAEISVSYYITYKSFTISEPVTRTISLDGTVWEMGNNLLYRLTLPTTEISEIEVKVDNIIDWNVEGEYTVYTDPITVECFVVNDYFYEATFDEEDAGLLLDVTVEDYEDSGDYGESENGSGIGDIIVNDYSDDDEYDETESGVVGDVTVEDYEESGDYGESENGSGIGSIIVKDYGSSGTYDESVGGVVGDITVEDYEDSGNYGESENGSGIGSIIVKDYGSSGTYDESVGGVVGDVTVEDYEYSGDYNESSSGIGGIIVKDYGSSGTYDETIGGVVGDVTVEGYEDSSDYNESDSGVGDTTVNDYSGDVSYDETNTDGGEVVLEEYEDEKTFSEEESASSTSVGVNDYKKSENSDLEYVD